MPRVAPHALWAHEHASGHIHTCTNACTHMCKHSHLLPRAGKLHVLVPTALEPAEKVFRSSWSYTSACCAPLPCSVACTPAAHMCEPVAGGASSDARSPACGKGWVGVRGQMCVPVCLCLYEHMFPIACVNLCTHVRTGPLPL